MLIKSVPAVVPDDPLVRGLAYLSRHLGRPVAAEVVARGLPLEDGRLAPTYLVDAARRADLLAREAELTEATLPSMALPVLAIRQDGEVALLLERQGARVLVSDGRGGGTWQELSVVLPTLARGWFVQAQLHLDGRSELYDPPRTQDWFWGPLRANAGIYAYAAAASLVINLGALLSTFYVMTVYDRVIPNRSMDTLWVLTMGVTALYAFDLVLKSLRGHLIDSASRRFDVMVGTHVFAHLLSLQPKDRPASAGTIANTVREFDALRDFFASATITALGDVPFLILFIAVVAYFAGAVAWVPLAAIPVVLGFAALFLGPVGRLTDKIYREAAQRNALLYEVVTGLDVVRTVGATAWARRKWDALLVQHAESSIASRELSQVSLNVTVFLQSLVSVGVIVVAAGMVAEGRLSTGAMVACTILAGRALAPLSTVAGLISRIHGMKSSLSALDKLMQAKGDDEGSADRLHLPTVAGRLTFQDVELSYPSGTTAPPRKALEGASLDVLPGEHLAMIGRVGSGKSSLLGLAVRLHTPQAGHVLIDGVDVRQLVPEDLRMHVGYVPQDPYLFHGSVRENIALGFPGASDEQVLAAARIACLDQLLGGTAEGLGLQVGEGGRALSGGMRQAVTIARAIVADPAILLLDEPTSMMDQATEQAVLERLFAARQGKTTLVITHRPAVLGFVAKVAVVQDGAVVVAGPKEQVLQQLANR